STEDTLYGNALPDHTIGNIELRERLSRYAEQNDSAAVPHDLECIAVRGNRPRHLENHIDAVGAGLVFAHGLVERPRTMGDVETLIGTKLGGQRKSPLHIGGFSQTYASRAERPRQKYGHQPERSGPENSHRFATDVCFLNGVNCIAERIEKRAYLRRYCGSIAALAQQNHVFVRKDNVLSEAAVEVNTLDFDVYANVLATGAAQQAVPASEVHFGSHVIARLNQQVSRDTVPVFERHSRTDRLYDPAKLMTDNDGMVIIGTAEVSLHLPADALALSALVNALVGSANCRRQHSYLYVVKAKLRFDGIK